MDKQQLVSSLFNLYAFRQTGFAPKFFAKTNTQYTVYTYKHRDIYVHNRC